MENAHRQFGTPEWLVLIGASVFILVLAVSAFFEADIRWLHFFQAWMYIVTIALSLQGNRWGYFVGISTAGFWDYANVFATTFFFNGLEELSHWVHTGHLARPDLFIAVPAWFSNLLVIIGCAWAYSRKPTKPRSDIIRVLVSFTLTTLFFRRRHGFVPAALPRHLSPIVTPAPSLGGSLTLLLLGVT